jgi:hypothetical protein
VPSTKNPVSAARRRRSKIKNRHGLGQLDKLGEVYYEEITTDPRRTPEWAAVVILAKLR